MEELFKIKIKNTEAAGIEIVPTSDGVEIIVARKTAKVQERESKPNLEILREFCGRKKNEEGIDRVELRNFWDWYSERMEDWKGRIIPEKLWERWIADETKRRKKNG